MKLVWNKDVLVEFFSVVVVKIVIRRSYGVRAHGRGAQIARSRLAHVVDLVVNFKLFDSLGWRTQVVIWVNVVLFPKVVSLLFDIIVMMCKAFTKVEDLNPALDGKEVIVRARVHNSRAKGKVCFIVLREQTSTV